MNNKSRIFLDSIAVNISNILEKIFFLIIGIIIARHLKPTLFGEYATALSFATFFSVFSNIGINQTLVRSINLDPEHEKEHLGNVFLIKTFLSIFIYLIMTISLYYTPYSRNIIHLTLILGMVRIGNEYLRTFYFFYEAKARFMITSLYNTAFSLLLMISTIFVVLYNGSYFDFAMTRLSIVLLIISIIAVRTLKNFKIKINLKTIKNFLFTALPFGLTSIINNFNERINTIILPLMHKNPTYTGIFQNGIIFITALSFIPFSLNKVLLPFLYKTTLKKNMRKIQFSFDFYSKFYAIMSFYLFIIFFCYAKNIIHILFKAAYDDTIPVLQILSFSIPFLFTPTIMLITSIDKQKVNTVIAMCAGILNIFSNIILIYYFKTEGAAMSTVITFASIYMLTVLYLVKYKYVSYQNIFVVLCKLISSTAMIVYIYYIYLQQLHFIISAIFVTIIYILCITLLLIRKNDIRIIKETLNLR